MTREDKQLLIKDLCARLPYGVKVIEDNQIIYSVAISNAFAIVTEFNRLDIKPILFPLSAINQEIEVNGEKITIGCTWKDTSLPELETRFRIDKEGNLFYDVCGALVPLNDYTHAIDTFHRYHIDYRGLIDKGLAISVFDLQKNPYRL